LNEEKPENHSREVGTLLLDGLHRLESHFDSLVRFEEVIMKKLSDAELKIENDKKREEVRHSCFKINIKYEYTIISLGCTFS